MTDYFHKPKQIYFAQLDIVHGCQLKCLGCPNSLIDSKIERVSLTDFSTILNNIDVERIHTLRLYNFGEPLLHKDLTGIVKLIPQQQWKASVVEISTNAQLVDWDDFEQMLQLEVVTRLVVSCDGDGSPEEYERLRPPSRWDRLTEFLDRAAKLRDRWSPGTQLMTRTVVKSNEDMQRWSDILLPKGWTPEFRSWMVLPGSKNNLTGRVVQVKNESCVYFAEPSAFPHHPWFGEINGLYMDADGTVVPCCMNPKAGVLGNLKNQKYSEIRSSQARKNMISEMETQRAKMSVCGSCEVGPAGREGPSFWSTMAYWNPKNSSAFARN